MLNIYDGNNVMLRAMTNQVMPSQVRLSLRQRYETARANDIWVWDGPKHNDRRKAIFPPYKGQRQPMAEDHFSQINLFKDLLSLSPATQITCPGWEADDVIATLALKGHRCAIHTNDLDYAQLRQLPTVTLVGVKQWDFDPKWLPLYKAMVGDPADNIPGIAGFGPKTWAELYPFAEDLLAAIRLGSAHAFHHLPLKPAILTWLAEPENLSQLQAMLAITYFQTVPEDDINAGISVGKPDNTAANALLRKYFL